MSELRKNAVKWKGNPTDLAGPQLKVGDKAPLSFTLTANDMSAVKGADHAGKPRIYLAVPSLDTPVCDLETRRFNQEAAGLDGVTVYVASMDLPFAQKRWCGAAGVDRVVSLSDFKDRSFGPAFGVLAPSIGLFARAVFVVDAKDTIRHVEYVDDATHEPNYEAALKAAKAML